MIWYCEKCKTTHGENELCQYMKDTLKINPELLKQAADFVCVAGQYSLITSNSLDHVARAVNKVTNLNLSYEGTHQFARDIAVFKRLSEEPFKNTQVFSNPANAHEYLESVIRKTQKLKDIGITDGRKDLTQILDKKLSGYAQEVDWLRDKKGQISSIWEKSTLLDGNAKGIDGVSINRFNGKTVSRTTIKSSINPVDKNGRLIADVKESIQMGNATENDIIYSVKGTATSAEKAGLSNPVIEKNTPAEVRASNDRLKQKIKAGNATTHVTMEQLSKKMAQGAVIGAAVGLTISSISNYLRYYNGDISKEEAFQAIGKDTFKSALIGASMAGITVFLPGGIIGFAAGFAIGVYVNKSLTNILDEIYGEGAYGAILNSAGYLCGMTYNLGLHLEQIAQSQKNSDYHLSISKQIAQEVEDNFSLFDRMKEDY